MRFLGEIIHFWSIAQPVIDFFREEGLFYENLVIGIKMLIPLYDF